jgi:hypothetical protein
MYSLINKKKIKTKINLFNIKKKKNKNRFKLISYKKINLNNYIERYGIEQFFNKGYKLNFAISINYKGKKNRYRKTKKKENINKVRNINYIKKYIEIYKHK